MAGPEADVGAGEPDLVRGALLRLGQRGRWELGDRQGEGLVHPEAQGGGPGDLAAVGEEGGLEPLDLLAGAERGRADLEGREGNRAEQLDGHPGDEPGWSRVGPLERPGQQRGRRTAVLGVQ